MSDFDFPSQPSQFSRALRACRELYVSSGQLCALEYPHLISSSGEEFVQLMDDLHRGLVMKIYFTVCEADRKWSKKERFLAEVLFHHLWDNWLSGENLRDTAVRASQQCQKLKWYSMVRPFDRIAPLRERVGELETQVVRIANLVARADGRLHPQESAAIRSIQDELARHLRPIPIDSPDQHAAADREGSQAIEVLRDQAESIYAATQRPADADTSQHTPVASADSRPAPAKQSAELLEPPQVSLADALGELDRLIGLDGVKSEVRTLTNFLKLQQRRGEAGLPQTDVSLHMVFNGNPGTGKTTVARILGKIFGAMGILSKGHLVETDRSGLVAEYAGQTGPKTNAKVDEALDGVLFIDEAYSLIAKDGDDPFGREAVQALLKRAEDNRARLVVILAGYPLEMEKLLRSNPGLSSRFGRKLKFADYTSLELSRIFGLFCTKNQYDLVAQARAKVLLGTDWWYGHRDRHFGNGRAVRNLFEDSVRRLANRIADIVEITAAQLTQLETSDISFPRVPLEIFQPLEHDHLRFNVACPVCSHAKDIPKNFLGQKLRCPKCEHDFPAAWGQIVREEKA